MKVGCRHIGSIKWPISLSARTDIQHYVAERRKVRMNVKNMGEKPPNKSKQKDIFKQFLRTNNARIGERCFDLNIVFLSQL